MHKIIFILIFLWLIKNIVKFFKKIKISYKNNKIINDKNFSNVQDGEFEEID